MEWDCNVPNTFFKPKSKILPATLRLSKGVATSNTLWEILGFLVELYRLCFPIKLLDTL